MSGMNLGGFLFGNIDESGALEDEFLDDDLKKALSSVARKGELGLNLDLSLVGVSTDDMEDKSVSVSLSIQESLVIDFSNIAEAAEDESVTLEPVKSPISIKEGQVVSQPRLSASKTSKPADMKSFSLTTDGKIIKHTLFYNQKAVQNRSRFKTRRLRIKKKKAGARIIHLLEDTQELLLKKSSPVQKPRTMSYLHSLLMTSSLKKKIPAAKARVLEEFANRFGEMNLATFPAPKNLADKVESDIPISVPNTFNVIDWESYIVFDEAQKLSKPPLAPLFAGIASQPTSLSRFASHTGSRSATPMQSNVISSIPSLRPSQPPSRASTPHQVAVTQPSKSIAGRVLNKDFLFGRWDEQIYWDDQKIPDFLPSLSVQLNLNDPSMIFDSIDIGHPIEKHPRLAEKTVMPMMKKPKKLRNVGQDGRSLILLKYDKPTGDRFNLSNDKLYEGSSKGDSGNSESKSGAKSLSSRLGIQHSIPALKLSMPFFKTFWTKSELRFWHRPRLESNLLKGINIVLSKLSTKKEGGRRLTTLTNSKKLSLKNVSSEFVLIEYSEEFPLLVMNVGMATLLVHFYRKKQSKDAPADLNLDFGIHRSLEPTENSPFWHFGEIKPGEMLPSIYNNMFRAPLAEHSTASTDFILIKSNIKGRQSSSWYLRPLPASILLSGQVMPTIEVFGPHSRKHNMFCRNRIQAFAYRLFRKDVPQTSSFDPDNLPRLRISRVMAAFPQFSEGSLRKWMKDYADSVRSGVDSGTWQMRKDAPILNEDDLRALVTPEMICQYESMLAGQQKLSDLGFMDAAEMEGDDEDNIIESHETNESKCAPWNLSANFVSAASNKCTLQLSGAGDPSGRGEAFSFVKSSQKNAIKLPTENAADEPSANVRANPDTAAYKLEISKIWESQLKVLRDNIPPEESDQQDFSIFDERSGAHGNTFVEDDAVSIHSQSSRSSSLRNMGGSSNKILEIKRVVKDPQTGFEREETETIRDPRLIGAYINQRRVWEQKRRRRMMAAAASAARAKKARAEDSDKPKRDVNVKCGTCGGIGHIRTNRICPRYAEYEAEMAASKGSSQSVPPAVQIQGPPPKISISKKLLESVASAPVAPPIKLKISLGPTPVDAHSTPVVTSKVSHPTVMSPLQQLLTKAIDDIIAIPDSWPFRKPVSKIDYPHYYQMIAKPMDLSTIKNRIKKNQYPDVSSFLSDVALVRDNCLQFNGPDHPFTATSAELYSKAETIVQSFHLPSEEADIQEDDIIDI